MVASLLLALSQAIKKALTLLVSPAAPAAMPVSVTLNASPSEVAKAARLSLVRWPSERIAYVPWLATNTPSSGAHAHKLHLKISTDGSESGQWVPVQTLLAENVSIAWGCCTSTSGQKGARAHLATLQGESVALRPEATPRRQTALSHGLWFHFLGVQIASHAYSGNTSEAWH